MCRVRFKGEPAERRGGSSHPPRRAPWPRPGRADRAGTAVAKGGAHDYIDTKHRGYRPHHSTDCPHLGGPAPTVPTLGTTPTTKKRARSPAWHRRLRSKRSAVRKLLTAAQANLYYHHGSMPPRGS